MDNSFGQKVKEIVSHGFTTVGISIGINLGLFELLSDFEEPRTSQEIADAGGFKERYVREWLGCMVCAGIIEVTENVPEKFFIPKNRQPFLDPRKTDSFPAMAASHLLAVIHPYDDLLECFKKDGPEGISLSRYTGMSGVNESRRRLTKLWCERYLITNVVNNVPNLHQKLNKGMTVLDVGCGAGETTSYMAKEFPSSTFVGLDISQEAIGRAVSELSLHDVKNVSYTCCDAIHLPDDWTSRFDYIFMRNVLHDLPFPNKALKECFRVLKGGGDMTIIDNYSHETMKENKTVSSSSMRYFSSLAHCMPQTLAVEGGCGLGAMAGCNNLKNLMEDSGFTVSKLIPISDSRCLFVCRKF